MVTQNDIARKLKVSQALVSKVLNNKIVPGGARADVVEEIRRMAEDLGYVKNLSSLELLSGRHHVIGAFLRRLGGSALFEPLVSGIAEEADRHHQKLWLRIYDEKSDMMQMLPKANRGAIDGLIFGTWFQKELIRPLIDLQKNGLRIIHPTEDVVYPKLSSVPRPRVESTRIATGHLIEQGCRKIAYVGVFGWRLQGYKDAHKKHGLRPNPKLQITISDYTNEESRRSAQMLLDNGINFDGIVFESDPLAPGAISVLLEQGIKIPKDVKLIGIDNVPFCKDLPIPLSSVDKREELRGITAVQVLMDSIHGKKPKAVKIEPILHVRESSS